MDDAKLEPFWKAMLTDLVLKGYSYEIIAKESGVSIAAFGDIANNPQCTPSPEVFTKLLCFYYWAFYCDRDSPHPESIKSFNNLRSRTIKLPN